MDIPKDLQAHIAEMEKSAAKPSAGLGKEKKSEVAQKARKGEDIGKQGKGFKKVEESARASGAEDPKAVAAAAMWKNIKRGSLYKLGKAAMPKLPMGDLMVKDRGDLGVDFVDRNTGKMATFINAIGANALGRWLTERRLNRCGESFEEKIKGMG